MRPSRPRTALYFGLLTAGLLLLALLGFQGFRGFLGLQAVGLETVSLLLIAVVAGVASFFSPCSFPLLLTLVGRDIAPEGGQDRTTLLRRTLALSLGVSGFLLLTGAALAAGAGAWMREITFTSSTGRALRAAVGAGLILLGVSQAGLLTIRFDALGRAGHGLQQRQANLRRRKPFLSYALYGFGYVLAGFG